MLYVVERRYVSFGSVFSFCLEKSTDLFSGIGDLVVRCQSGVM